MRTGIVKLDNSVVEEDDWEINLDGPEITRIKNNLSYMSDDEKFSTVISAAKILSHCPNPKSHGGRKTGLAIGKIQSGKTSNFISLMALAFDNGYNIIVVFGGTKNNLLDQTETRIKRMFDIENNKREDRNVVVLSKSSKFGSTSPELLNRMYRNGRKIIITALKQKQGIQEVNRYLREAGLTSKPILLIDDEGDQASLNAKVSKEGRTVIYNELLTLRESLNHVCFISITATPQALLLIDTIDSLSPDFCQLVEPGRDYIGGSMFHGENQDLHVIELPEDENEMLDGDGIPDSFLEALGVFYVGSVVRKYRNEGKNHVMLIHPSQLKPDHEDVKNKVDLVLQKWLNNSELDKSEFGFQQLEKYLKIGYDELSRTVENMPAFDLILENINEQLADSRTNIINGLYNTDIDYYINRNIIIIGGNLVERGLTINDLAVTYIVRRSKNKANADTVEQRARWFGYRKNYFDLCRVYCTKKIKNDFSNLLSHEDDIWEWIKYCQKNDINIKDMPRLFELDNNLDPTRKAVVPRYDEIRFGNWTEQKGINLDSEYIKMVNDAWETMLSKYEYVDVEIGNLKHRKYSKVPLSEVHNVISNYYTDDKLSFNYKYPYAVEQRKNIDNDEPVVTILLMRVDTGEVRSFDDNMVITSNLMQGHSQNRFKNDPLYYPGDRYIFLDETQLQIHNIHPKINDIENNLDIPMLAFYSPVINSRRVIGRFDYD